MDRATVIKIVYKCALNIPIIFSTGYACREAFAIEDRKTNFYMLGSMGLAASIGIGLATNLDSKPVIVIEGDGSLLMNPSNMFIAGLLGVKNLIHIVLDNNSYESTGGQITNSKDLEFPLFAKFSGYKTSLKIESKEVLQRKLTRAICEQDGPYFFHIPINLNFDAISPRVSNAPVEIKERFVTFLKECKTKTGAEVCK